MLEEEVRELEEQLTKPAVRASAEALDRIISDEFVEFGSSGRIYHKRDVVEQLLSKPNVSITLLDLQVLPLTEDVALATYRTTASLRSSVWRREPSGWRVIFHQGTPLSSET